MRQIEDFIDTVREQPGWWHPVNYRSFHSVMIARSHAANLRRVYGVKTGIRKRDDGTADIWVKAAHDVESFDEGGDDE
jgi:hypothetical protein